MDWFSDYEFQDWLTEELNAAYEARSPQEIQDMIDAATPFQMAAALIKYLKEHPHG